MKTSVKKILSEIKEFVAKEPRKEAEKLTQPILGQLNYAYISKQNNISIKRPYKNNNAIRNYSKEFAKQYNKDRRSDRRSDIPSVVLRGKLYDKFAAKIYEMNDSELIKMRDEFIEIEDEVTATKVENKRIGKYEQDEDYIPSRF